jgi:hypothetical protein
MIDAIVLFFVGFVGWGLVKQIIKFFTMKPDAVDADMLRLMHSINEAEYNWRWRAYMQAPTQQTLEAAWKADKERQVK